MTGPCTCNMQESGGWLWFLVGLYSLTTQPILVRSRTEVVAWRSLRDALASIRAE